MHITATKRRIIVCAIENRPEDTDSQIEVMRAGATFISDLVEEDGIDPSNFSAITMIAGKVVRELLAPDSAGFVANSVYIILEDKDEALSGDAMDLVVEAMGNNFGEWLRLLK